MNKIVLAMLTLLTHHTYAFDIDYLSSPIKTQLYTFCDLQSHCTANIRFENTTPYHLKMSSTRFFNNHLSLEDIDVFDAKKYAKQAAKNQDIFTAEIPPLKKKTPSKQLSSITLSPNEVKFFELSNMASHFPLVKDTFYIANYYVSPVSLYVNNTFVGSVTLSTNYAQLTIPSPLLELKQENFKKEAISNRN